MGNHTIDCHFCGKDQRLVGDRCCPQHIESEETRRAVSDARVQEDVRYLEQFGLRPSHDALERLTILRASDVARVLRQSYAVPPGPPVDPDDVEPQAGGPAMTFREVMEMSFGSRQYSAEELDRLVNECKDVLCDMVESKSSRAAIGEALTGSFQALRNLSSLAGQLRNFPRHKLEGALTFARQTWRNDGAEGETVHLLCNAVDLLLNTFSNPSSSNGSKK